MVTLPPGAAFCKINLVIFKVIHDIFATQTLLLLNIIIQMYL